ncbi:WD_REPEATS_REGION domain-containing protein, partial [Haematococcus lacustris]
MCQRLSCRAAECWSAWQPGSWPSSPSALLRPAGLSPVTGLLAVAGEDGQLECFDLRARTSLACFDAATSAGAAGQELTALRFDDTGLQLAVGTGNGLVAVFDMRSK